MSGNEIPWDVPEGAWSIVWERTRTSWRLLIGVLIKATLIVLIIWRPEALSMTVGFAQLLIAGVVLVVSNIASNLIVGWIKDAVLWVLTDPSDQLRKDWYSRGFGSRISPALGILERLIVTGAGLISFWHFYIVSGGWLGLKVAVDWQQFGVMPNRAIGHIYLVSSAASLFLAIIDVAFLRSVLGIALTTAG
jgi:hypothetical protein